MEPDAIVPDLSPHNRLSVKSGSTTNGWLYGMIFRIETLRVDMELLRTYRGASNDPICYILRPNFTCHSRCIKHKIIHQTAGQSIYLHTRCTLASALIEEISSSRLDIMLLIPALSPPPCSRCLPLSIIACMAYLLHCLLCSCSVANRKVFVTLIHSAAIR